MSWNPHTPRNFSTSLLRVHPTFYLEAKETLWNRTCFEFHGPGGTIDALDSLGPSPSQFITNIVIRMTYEDFDNPLFPRAISIINSQARHGKLQSVVLELTFTDIQEIIPKVWGEKYRKQDFNLYDRLRLMSSAQAWRCHRAIKIEGCESYEELRSQVGGTYHLKAIMYVVEKLHWAWGGSFYLGNMMVWENGHRRD